MSIYARGYERELKKYDRELFVGHNMEGVLCVFRHTKRFEPVIETPEFKLMNLRHSKEYVFAITDTWGLSGKPVDHGVDDVVGHLRKIDVLANARFVEELDAQNERVNESRDRAMQNEMEAFWSHERNRFVRTTNDILTHSMSKDEPKKRLRDRRIKNGNY